MSLAYSEYQMELNIAKVENLKVASMKVVKLAETTKSDVKNMNFLEYLQYKQYVNAEGIINVEKLVGTKLTLGNGTGTKDVYKVEGTYTVNYYDNNGTTREIWSIKQTAKYITMQFKIYDNHDLSFEQAFNVQVPEGWTMKDLVESEIYTNEIQPKGWTAEISTIDELEEKYYIGETEISDQEYDQYMEDERLNKIQAYYLDGVEITKEEYDKYQEQFSENEEDLERLHKKTRFFIDGMELSWNEELMGQKDVIEWRQSIKEYPYGPRFELDYKIEDGCKIEVNINPAECVTPNTKILVNGKERTKLAKDTKEGWKSKTGRNGYKIPQIGDEVKSIEGWKKIVNLKTYQGKEDCYDFVIEKENGKKVNNYYANGTLVEGAY